MISSRYILKCSRHVALSHMNKYRVGWDTSVYREQVLEGWTEVNAVIPPSSLSILREWIAMRWMRASPSKLRRILREGDSTVASDHSWLLFESFSEICLKWTPLSSLLGSEPENYQMMTTEIWQKCSTCYWSRCYRSKFIGAYWDYRYPNQNCENQSWGSSDSSESKWANRANLHWVPKMLQIAEFPLLIALHQMIFSRKCFGSC